MVTDAVRYTNSYGLSTAGQAQVGFNPEPGGAGSELVA